MERVLKGCVFVLLLSVLDAAYAQSQPSEGAGEPVVAGSVHYNQVDAPQKNGQLLSLEKAIAWGEELEKLVKEGGKSAPASLEDATISYLSVLYLYCTSNQGVCSFMLDSILEGDLLASRSTGAPACPTMKKFWKAWLSSGLEERAKFNKSIAHGLEVAEFNSTLRPKYIQCGGTVKNLLSEQGELTKRYGPDGTSTKEVANFLRFLKEVESQKIDIYRSTGVLDGSEEPTGKSAAVSGK
jgi:hypothetical protein